MSDFDSGVLRDLLKHNLDPIRPTAGKFASTNIVLDKITAFIISLISEARAKQQLPAELRCALDAGMPSLLQEIATLSGDLDLEVHSIIVDGFLPIFDKELSYIPPDDGELANLLTMAQEELERTQARVSAIVDHVISPGAAEEILHFIEDLCHTNFGAEGCAPIAEAMRQQRASGNSADDIELTKFLSAIKRLVTTEKRRIHLEMAAKLESDPEKSKSVYPHPWLETLRRQIDDEPALFEDIVLTRHAYDTLCGRLNAENIAEYNVHTARLIKSLLSQEDMQEALSTQNMLGEFSQLEYDEFALLEKYYQDVYRGDNSSLNKLLRLWVQRGDRLKSLEFILVRGAEPLHRFSGRVTALHLTAENFYAGGMVAEILFQHRPLDELLQQQDISGHTPLAIAILESNVGCVESWLPRITPNTFIKTDGRGNSLFHLAADIEPGAIDVENNIGFRIMRALIAYVRQHGLFDFIRTQNVRGNNFLLQAVINYNYSYLRIARDQQILTPVILTDENNKQKSIIKLLQRANTEETRAILEDMCGLFPPIRELLSSDGSLSKKRRLQEVEDDPTDEETERELGEDDYPPDFDDAEADDDETEVDAILPDLDGEVAPPPPPALMLSGGPGGPGVMLPAPHAAALPLPAVQNLGLLLPLPADIPGVMPLPTLALPPELLQLLAAVPPDDANPSQQGYQGQPGL